MLALLLPLLAGLSLAACSADLAQSQTPAYAHECADFATFDGARQIFCLRP
jgi:hypothetical protein